jgi:hypothetical protein
VAFIRTVVAKALRVRALISSGKSSMTLDTSPLSRWRSSASLTAADERDLEMGISVLTCEPQWGLTCPTSGSVGR